MIFFIGSNPGSKSLSQFICLVIIFRFESENMAGENFSLEYKPDRVVKVIKKDGSLEAFNVQKVIDAVGKSAYRALTKFTDEEKRHICQTVVDKVNELGEEKIPIQFDFFVELFSRLCYT